MTNPSNNDSKNIESSYSEKLEFIDSILSQLETGNENENAENIDLPFKIENPLILRLKDNGKQNSPLVFEKTQSKLSNINKDTPSNLIKKSKSFQLPNCSTPKYDNNQVNKELEMVNLLFLSGKLSSQSSQKAIENDDKEISIKKNCTMSPIITSSAKIAQSKTYYDSLKAQEIDSPKLEYTLPLTKEEIDLAEIDGLNRNLNFDDANFENETTNINKKDMSDEDEQLLAHMTKIENNTIIMEKSIDQKVFKNVQNFTSIGFHAEKDKNNSLDHTNKKFNNQEAKKQNNKNFDSLSKDKEVGFDGANQNSMGFGFQTAGGKKIQIKEDSLKKAKEKIWDKIDEIVSVSKETEQSSLSKNTDLATTSGFQTANGKKINISESSLKLAHQRIIEKLDDSEMKESDAKHNFNLGFQKKIELFDKKDTMKPDTFSIGFKTATGKNISIREDSLKLAREKIFEKNEDDDYSTKKNEIRNDFSTGFKTVSGKTIEINKNSYEEALKKFESTDIENSNLDKMNSFGGFKTATGKSILVKEESLKFVKEKILDNIDDSKLELTNSFNGGFKTVSGKQILVNKDALEAARKNFDLNDYNAKEQSNKPVLEAPIATVLPKTPLVNSMPPSINNKRVLDGKHFKKPQLIHKTKLSKYIEAPTDESKLASKESLSNDDMCISINNLFENSNISILQENGDPNSMNNKNLSLYQNNTSSRLNSNSFRLNNYIHNNEFIFNPQKCNQVTFLNANEFELKEISRNSEKTTSHKLFVVKPILELKTIQVDYSAVCNKKLSEDSIQTKNFEMNRLNAYNNQIKRLELKKSQSLKPNERSIAGHLLNFKKKFKNSLLCLEKFKINKSIQSDDYSTDVSDSELLDLKFNFFETFSSEKSIYDGFILTHDGGCLIPNKNLSLGIDELFNCFLDSKGVDSNLVDLIWFKNHFKWITWKLSSYDYKFNGSFTEKKFEVLNPINVLLQIKYRYDIEIGNAKRSCVKRLIEKDDTSANKLIILFISDILKNNTNTNLCYIELSDGWYPIKALCDVYLTEYLSNKKIKIGDKLAIYSAELYGCPKDGCPPLEAPEDLFLKLSVNSTRKAKWFTKLGFLKTKSPLKISLDSIKANSNVGAIDVIVERIYPLQYFETKPDGSKICRNQKQEEMLNYKNQIEYENFNFNNSCHDETDYDTNSNKSNNSNQRAEPQNKSLQVQRNVKQILKIRLVDAFGKNKDNTQKKTSYILTVWQNANDLQEKLKEGERLLILNISASKSSYQEANICLGTNRQTRFIFYKKNKSSNSNFIHPFHSIRQNYCYSNLYSQQIFSPYNEIDICGIVVLHTTNTYQNLVYLSNLSESDDIVCVCFPKNSEFYGFKETLKSFSLVACLNLKFINKKELSKYPCLLANEMSIFSQKINGFKFLTSEFNALNESALKAQNKSRLIEISNLIQKETNEYVYRKPLNNGFKTNSSIINDSLNNESKSENIKELKANKLLAIAQTDEMPPLMITKSGLRHPGLIPNSKQALTPNFGSKFQLDKSIKNKTPNQSLIETSTSKSLKRSSDIFESSISVSNFSNCEEDEDDNYIINQDLEALCKSKTKKIKTDN